VTEPEAIIKKLLATVPEFTEHYPMTIVMDTFADRVRDWVGDGAPDELLDRCFAAVEQLAASDEERLRDVVIVSFLEAALWGEMGAVARFGPATRRLIHEADPQMIDPVMLDEA
jgi:hypothetical protein